MKDTAAFFFFFFNGQVQSTFPFPASELLYNIQRRGEFKNKVQSNDKLH